MVIDNVDDRALFFDELNASSKSLHDYLPQCPHGALLFTSRSKDVALDIALDRKPIHVSPMTMNEGRAMLGHIQVAGTDGEQDQLLERLAYLPLAISQATAFMVRRRKSVPDYVKLYDESEAMKLKLLGRVSPFLTFLPQLLHLMRSQLLQSGCSCSFHFNKQRQIRGESP